MTSDLKKPPGGPSRLLLVFFTNKSTHEIARFAPFDSLTKLMRKGVHLEGYSCLLVKNTNKGYWATGIITVSKKRQHVNT